MTNQINLIEISSLILLYIVIDVWKFIYLDIFIKVANSTKARILYKLKESDIFTDGFDSFTSLCCPPT